MIPGEDLSLGVERHDRVGRGVDEGAEAPIGRPERLLLPLPVGHVLGHALHRHDGSRLVAHRNLRDLEHADGSVLVEDLDEIGRLGDPADAQVGMAHHLEVQGVVGEVGGVVFSELVQGVAENLGEGGTHVGEDAVRAVRVEEILQFQALHEPAILRLAIACHVPHPASIVELVLRGAGAQ